MPYLDFTTDTPGIRQAMIDYPETAKPLNELAERLLRTDEELSRGERELIAAYVSRGNECNYCSNSHLSAALVHLELPSRMIDVMTDDVTDGVEVRPVVRALLDVAAQVRQGGRAVDPETIEAARRAGATDRMIHDTVLIAAAFCMYNRYVDGLSTLSPRDPALYEATGRRLAANGYLNSVPS
jgi:uncharacterized peroxidase-related enzyme